MKIQKIGTVEIQACSKKCGSIRIGELSDGSPVDVPVIVVKGKKPGPRVWIEAMIHGDEFDPSMALLRVVSGLDPEKMSGTVIAIPCLNVLACRSYARAATDPSYYFHNVDLNLAFPGNMNGDFMEQAADILLEEIKTNSDYMIDLHSAGLFDMIWPFWTLVYDDGSKSSQESLKLAKVFGIEQIVATKFKEVGTAGYELTHGSKMPFAVTTSLGIPSILVEAGGGADFKERIVEEIATGILNVLKHLRIIDGHVEEKKNYTIFPQIVDVYTRHGGIFVSEKTCGTDVSKGEKLGTLKNMFGEKIEDVVSPIDGTIISHHIYPFVSSGILLFHIGPKPRS
jgi:predicted deacylase